MARQPRKVSGSGFYHVTMRGNGKQVIFENDEDRWSFLDFLNRSLAQTKITLIAWCLMSNHVHLLLRDDAGDIDALSRAMQWLQAVYARQFNDRTGHVGHVFQGRFASAPIEDEAYLLETVRYIHNNPLDIGVRPDCYFWSSYREYVGEPRICDTAAILNELGGAEGFAAFLKDRPLQEFHCATERRKTISDDRAREIAADIFPGLSLDEVKSLPKQERDEILRSLRSEGISVRQLERLTGIGRNVISRAL